MLLHERSRLDDRIRRLSAVILLNLGGSEIAAFGEAPANEKSCDLTENKDHCDVFHAKEEDYWTNVWYWTTPTENCLDGRTDVKCVPYKDWVAAWTSLRSS